MEIVTLPRSQYREDIEDAYASGFRRGVEYVTPLLEDVAARVNLPHTKAVLTTREAARHARVSVATVLRWHKHEGLRGERVPGVKGLRFRTADLDAFLTNRAPGVPA